MRTYDFENEAVFPRLECGWSTLLNWRFPWSQYIITKLMGIGQGSRDINFKCPRFTYRDMTSGCILRAIVNPVAECIDVDLVPTTCKCLGIDTLKMCLDNGILRSQSESFEIYETAKPVLVWITSDARDCERERILELKLGDRSTEFRLPIKTLEECLPKLAKVIECWPGNDVYGRLKYAFDDFLSDLPPVKPRELKILKEACITLAIGGEDYLLDDPDYNPYYISGSELDKYLPLI